MLLRSILLIFSIIGLFIVIHISTTLPSGKTRGDHIHLLNKFNTTYEESKYSAREYVPKINENEYIDVYSEIVKINIENSGFCFKKSFKAM